MKLQKLVVPLVAVLCVLATRSASAGATNIVTFSATTFQAGAPSDDGTTTTFPAVKGAPHSTAELIHLLGNDTGNSFSTAAKLVLIDNQFGVLDGGNLVDVSTIVSLSFGSTSVKSGKQNNNTGLASPALKEIQIVTFHYDDTNPSIGGFLQFSLQGIANAAETDTVPDGNGVYTEGLKAKVSSMTGEGSDDHGPFVATGSLAVSGKGVLQLPP